MSNNQIDNLLERERPQLTAEERAVMLRKIKAASAAPVPSPYSVFIFTKNMTSILVALVLIIGTAGTVAASGSSKPGDLLFPLERAVERVQVALASESRSAELRVRFADERLAELREIVNEEAVATLDDSTIDNFVTSTTDPIVITEAEADVFTDTTIVKVEANNQKFWFTITATTRAEVVEAIAERFGVDGTSVEALLDFEVENRASRPSDRGTVVVDDRGEERIGDAVNIILDYLEKNENEKRAEHFALLIKEIEKITVEGRSVENDDNSVGNSSVSDDSSDNRRRIKIKDDRIEIREDGFRLRIDDDGEIRLRIDDDSNSRSSSQSSQFEAEADVFFDTTVVEVEINDRKSVFETTAKTREAVIDEIVNRYAVERAVVEAVLDFEIEDRNARARDLEEVGSQSDDDDDDSNSSSSNSDDSQDESRGIERFDVKVEEGQADVRIDFDGKRLEYEVSYTSRDALLQDASSRTGYSVAELAERLDIEMED